MRKFIWGAALVAVAGMQGALSASTIRFDEFGISPEMSLNGVVFAGVHFDFLPPYDASFNGSIGGGVLYLLDPVMEGDTNGVVTLRFDAPVSELDFDVALLTLADIPQTNPGPAYHVDLWRGAENVLAADESATAELFYAESHFRYAGAAVDRADISFYNGQDPFGDPGQEVTRFALDNLTFNAPNAPLSGLGAAAQAPDPQDALLLGSGLVFIGLIRKRRTAGAR